MLGYYFISKFTKMKPKICQMITEKYFGCIDFYT